MPKTAAPTRTNTRAAAPDDFDDSIDMDRVRRESNANQFWQPRDGENNIRILPIPSVRSFFLTAEQHFNLGPDQRERMFCTLKHDGSQCAACEIRETFLTSEDPRMQVVADDIRAKKQYYSAIVDLDKADRGIQVYAYGPMVMKGIRAITDDAAEYGNPFSIKEGRNWKITKSKKGSDARSVDYAVNVRTSTSPFRWEGAGNLAQAIEQRMEGVIEYLSFEEQQAKVRGTGLAKPPAEGIPGPDGIEWQDGDVPKARRNGTRAAAPAAPARPPAGTTRPRRPAPVVEVEEDEDAGWKCVCKRQNSGDARFCSKCGKPAPVDETEDEDAANACADCGTANAPDARFCTNCGVSMIEPEDLPEDDEDAEEEEEELAVTTTTASRLNSLRQRAAEKK